MEYIRQSRIRLRNNHSRRAVFRATPFLLQHQYGGDLGGPAILPNYHGRNRTFFLWLRALQIPQEKERNIQTFPSMTAAQRTGAFLGSTDFADHKRSETGFPYPAIYPASPNRHFRENTMVLYCPLPISRMASTRPRLWSPNRLDGTQFTVNVAPPEWGRKTGWGSVLLEQVHPMVPTINFRFS